MGTPNLSQSKILVTTWDLQLASEVSVVLWDWDLKWNLMLRPGRLCQNWIDLCRIPSCTQRVGEMVLENMPHTLVSKVLGVKTVCNYLYLITFFSSFLNKGKPQGLPLLPPLQDPSCLAEVTSRRFKGPVALFPLLFLLFSFLYPDITDRNIQK